MKKIIATFFITISCYSKIFAADMTDMESLVHNINELCELYHEYSTIEDQNRVDAIPEQIDTLIEKILSNPAGPQLIANELLEASREPKEKELPAVNALIAFLRSTGIEISEARYITPTSAMPKACIDETLMASTMSFIENPANDTIVKDSFLSYYFSNEEFKSKMLDDISAACKESRLFRELLVSLILKAKFPHVRNSTKLCSPAWYPNRLCFFESEYPQSEADSIYFPYNFTGMSYFSFFENRYAKKEIKKGLYATTQNNTQIIFHEMAHSWIGDLFACASKFGIDNTIELFSKIITGINFNNKAFEEFFAHLHAAPKEAQEKYIKRHNGLFYTKFTTLDEVKTHLMEKMKSPEGITEIVFTDSAETIQIIGLALVKCGDRNVLFINSLSDWVLSMELNRSVRNDHTVYAINPENEIFKYIIPEKLYLSHTMNVEFYEKMFAIYGSSIQQYVMKLIYGDNLLSTLKLEWSLWKKAAGKILLEKQTAEALQNAVMPF